MASARPDEIGEPAKPCGNERDWLVAAWVHSVVLLKNSRGGTRTPDPVINSHLLYQLSYSGRCNRAA
jgi:hypothetical protein